MAVVNHGFRSNGGLVTALGALITTIPADCITVPTATLGVDIAMRPLELIQILLAGFFSGKPLDKLSETQSFLFRHFWHLPFDASIHLLMSVSLDTIAISSVVLTKADNIKVASLMIRLALTKYGLFMLKYDFGKCVVRNNDINNLCI